MQRFLISRLSSLGDVVCCLPAATALKRSFPDSEIVWAVDPRFAAVVECCRAVDEVVHCTPSLSVETWKTNGSFDVAFDLQGLLKSALIVARSRSKLKLGYHWQREGSAFFSSKVMPDSTSFHIVDQYVDVIRAAGAEADRAEFMLEPELVAASEIDAMLRDTKVTLPYAVLNAGAGWVSKRWPTASFAALSQGLAERGIDSVFIGGKADSDHHAFHEVATVSNFRPKSLVGKTNIKQLIALIGRCTVHVGGDTGSTHIAAALGVPAVGLYSITRPERSCPYGQIDNCLFDPISLARISSEMVLNRALTASSGNSKHD